MRPPGICQGVLIVSVFGPHIVVVYSYYSIEPVAFTQPPVSGIIEAEKVKTRKESTIMNNKLTPPACLIAAGLEEAIAHAKGEQVPGIRAVNVPDANSADSDKGRE